MARVRRGLLAGLGVLASVGVVAGCRPMSPAAKSDSLASTSAASSDARTPSNLDRQALASPAECPISALQIGAVFGGAWVAASNAGDGCSYTQGRRVIIASSVRAPAGTAARQQALDQVRRPCDAGSVISVSSTGFACVQKTVVAGAALVGGELLCVFTEIGNDATLRSQTRSMLATLVAAAT